MSNSFISLLNQAGKLSLPQTQFNGLPTCVYLPVLDKDLANKQYVDSMVLNPQIHISNILVSDYLDNLNVTTGDLNIDLSHNTLNYIINDTNVSQYGSNFALGQGMTSVVNSLITDLSNNVYLGTDINCASGVENIYGIAKFDGINWVNVGTGLNNGCLALTLDVSGNIYAGGSFTMAGGVSASRIAKWDGTNWSALGSGLGGNCFCVAVDPSGNVYAGGQFNMIGDNQVNNIAKWDGTEWSALGNGFSDVCRTIAIDSSGNVYAGGDFSWAGSSSGSFDVQVNNIAKWDGTEWSALGNGLSGTCRSITIDSSGNVYAVGDFLNAGDNPANRIAKWDGTNWSALGDGLNNTCYTVIIDLSGNICVGGNFTSPGYRAVKWDGTNWTQIGNGISDNVNSISVDLFGNYYIGGNFIYPRVCYFAKTVNLSINNKFMCKMRYGQVISANVSSSGVPYTSGDVV